MELECSFDILGMGLGEWLVELERSCDILGMCLVTTIKEGVRAGGGISNVLRKPASSCELNQCPHGCNQGHGCTDDNKCIIMVPMTRNELFRAGTWTGGIECVTCPLPQVLIGNKVDLHTHYSWSFTLATVNVHVVK